MGKNKFSRDDKTNTREEIPAILIVCEGAKTEPNYFGEFRIPTMKVEVVGTGRNTVSLVNETIKLKSKSKYHQVWCVFDKDSFSVKQFNDAVQLAKSENISVAYSNESFELWYILHFMYLESQINREAYIIKLTKIFEEKSSKKEPPLFPKEYKKNDPNMYTLLKQYQKTALKNAEKLAKQYTSEFNPSPATQFPVTYVYKLVAELNQWLASERLD